MKITIEDLLNGIADQAKRLGWDVGLDLAVRTIPEGIIVVDSSWGGLVPVAWGDQITIFYHLEAVRRGMRVLRRAGRRWWIRHPSDWRVFHRAGWNAVPDQFYLEVDWKSVAQNQ